MSSATDLLGLLAYEFTKAQPMLPTYLHVLLTAVFSIYTGAHASLSRPSSAAKPSKHSKGAQEVEEDEDSDDEEAKENEQKMEGLSPVDAILFPLLAGCTLAGLYVVIKWLEDPALLNKILNWYFSVFGVLSVARLLTDSMGVLTSYAFPRVYTSNGKLWRVSQKSRTAQSISTPSHEHKSPLPGWFSTFGLSSKNAHILWTLREFPSYQFRIRAYVHKLVEARFRIGPQGFISLFLAILAVLYFNLVDKPWWLTNILGLSFAYSALQLMSPTTHWTGTMLLTALFFYDIYFVFFTPLMVTVAKKLDIPAKLLFPRPSGPNDDPDKQSLAMLGLGDIVLPGMMIGLALRFDLYLFYLRKQSKRALPKEEFSKDNEGENELVKIEWRPAAGGWGERFWTTHGTNDTEWKEGGRFPKTYFNASLFGYVIGLITTLGVMQVYGHAQPALLYLVPCVLGFIWGTALLKGDIKLMWGYNEAIDEKSDEVKSSDSKGLASIFAPSRQEQIAERVEKQLKETNDPDKSKSKNEDARKSASAKNIRSEIFSFSISLPKVLLSDRIYNETSSKDEKLTRPSLEDELRLASEDDIMTLSSSSSLSARRQSIVDKEGEPAEKRQRRE